MTGPAAQPHSRKPQRRRYSLFEKVDGRWHRRSNNSFFKSDAVRVFQSTLISSFFEGKHYELRPVKREV